MGESKSVGALREREAARYLAVSERTLYTLRRTGEIKFFRVGSTIRYRREALEEFMARQEAKQRQIDNQL